MDKKKMGIGRRTGEKTKDLREKGLDQQWTVMKENGRDDRGQCQQ